MYKPQTKVYAEVWEKSMKFVGKSVQEEMGWTFDGILPNGNFKFSDRTIPENLVITKEGVKSLLLVVGNHNCFTCERCGILFLGTKCPYCGITPHELLKTSTKRRV